MTTVPAAVLFEPTNMLKAHLPLMADNRDVITHTSPNLAELRAMAHFVKNQHLLLDSTMAVGAMDTEQGLFWSFLASWQV